MFPVGALWFATSWVALPSPDDAAILGVFAVAGQKVVQRALPYIDDVGRRFAPYVDDLGHRVGPYVDGAGRVFDEVGKKTTIYIDRAGDVVDDARPVVSRLAEGGQQYLDDGLRVAQTFSSRAGDFARQQASSVKTVVTGKADDIVAATVYSRAAFGWNAATRQKVLRDMSTNPVVENAGRITHGRWFNDYTGEVMTNAAEVAVDHVVPLHWAWENGAAGWSAEQRAAFANDPLNLRVTDHATNGAKGSKGLEAWTPDDPSLKRQYELRFRAVAKKYGLKLAKAL